MSTGGSPERRPRTRAPLRIGLLLDDSTVAAWAARVLERVTAEGIATIALVVMNDGSAGPDAPAAGRRSVVQRARTWYRNRDALAFALYQRYDERRYGRADSPDTRVDIAPLIADVDVVRVKPRMTKFCDYLSDADVERIAGYDLDVAIRFGFRILKGGVLGIARHGVWSYHHGDNTVNRGGPAGFWEVMEQHEVTGAVLQRLTEDLDGGEVLARSFSSTDPFSVTANRANYYWQATELLVTQLRALAEREDGSPSESPPPPRWSAYTRRLYRRPGTREVLAHWARLGARLLRSKLRSIFFEEQWILAYRFVAVRADDEDAPSGDFYRFRELVPPADRFWADPFPVVADGRHFVFFEEFRKEDPHAHIAVVELGQSGPIGPHRVVLRRPYHLSYPSVFRWNGEWYMMPETASRQTIELYRAIEFPDRWEHVADLVTGLRAVDATIAEIDGRWWMFVGVMIAGASEATALHLFSAPSPLGPWMPHRRNPVKIDVRGARPGGRVFRHGGRYYRVGQDGAPRYGSALRVFSIDSLDDLEYSETEVERITPSWRPGLVGTHTLNASGGLTTIDVRQVRRKR